MPGIYDVVRRPLVTERGMKVLEASNTYVFEVHPRANKVQIRNAVEKLFGVHVLSVNTAIVKGKVKRRRLQEAQLPDHKKAYVRLKEGDAIELF
jgi:large subunit ribosomal protein L23